MYRSLKIILFLHYVLALRLILCLPDRIAIGMLTHENHDEQENIFRWSIEQVNRRGLLNSTKLYPLTERVQSADSWNAERKACNLIEQGAITIIGPSDPLTNLHVQSICDTLDIPHINVAMRGVAYYSNPLDATNIIVGSDFPKQSTPKATFPLIDLNIPRTTFMEAYLSLCRALGWRKFVYLYEQDDTAYHVLEHFRGKNIKSVDMSMQVHRFDPSKPYRETFWMLKHSKVTEIMLDVKCSSLKTVLKHAQQVSMMTEMHSFLVACQDTQAFDLDDFKHGKSRIIWLNLIDTSSEAMNLLKMHTKLGSLAPDKIKTESALIYDAVTTIALTLDGIDPGQYLKRSAQASCRLSKSLEYGSTFVNYMRALVDVGDMTGRIRFDSEGKRSDYQLNILRLTEDGPRIVGNWTHNVNKSISLDENELVYLQKGDQIIDEGLQKDVLIVTSIKSDPYFMIRQTTTVEDGNARYEGYAIDLIDELSRIVNFNYIFKEVDDGLYGLFNESTKQWNGMIREVMIGKADLAIADLSITSPREDAVDFTLPFMSTGISILFKKPTTKELELFSFLSPFENHVWVYVCGAYIGVSILLFAVSRISPYEWADPHPCRQEDRILRNQFSILNSFWFTIAALMQQGSDLAPRSLSSRLVSAFWYFFTLILINSYTANLAAFLTVEKVVYPIERAEDLYKNPAHIEYGCLGSGSTLNFFKNSNKGSTFEKLYQEMNSKKWFVKSNDEGTMRANEGNYAFFMESTSIEYKIERNCNLTQIGGLLDSKGYGIAIAKNSSRKRDYRAKLSEAILALQENGMLEILKNRWWKEKRGGGACDIDESQGGESVKELTLANVGGVFVVLVMGIVASFTLVAMELYLKSYRQARMRGISKWDQLKRRIKFALALSENY